ncbi:MFS transporter [Prolixibacter denitrificans]|uniref:Lysosomal dipeptide transporter MFSD1 n=2 Tax=Prolixibacter denitrificans TaxID=1541063 RepID=A0A2P8C8Z3_9BACT|nr:MFS transporter [Prolixibacter denitrificans]PSK81430.1 nitrate/nitrite transporter NarK [Prolixibacter denitrificans]
MTEAIRKSLRESPKARWTAMVVVSLSMFGAYYFNYALSPVKPILESALGWTSSDFGVYTSAYAWFNVYFLMLIFSGIILDRLGIKITGLGATVLMVLGTGVNYWAITAPFPAGAHVTLPLVGDIKTEVLLSSIGFAIFGVGSEATGITVSKAIVKWFKGKEMALAMGLQMSIARLGTALALAISLPLALHFTYRAPVAFAFILMLLGVIAFITYIVLDTKLDKSEEHIEVEEEEPFRLRDIVMIISNKAFWYIAILCVLFYGAVFPFLFYATDFIINKYHVSPSLAGLIPSLLPFGTIFLTPFFGGIYDKKGKGATIMIIGAVMLIVVHGFLSIPTLDNWIFAAAMVVILGIAFSLVPSAMWPSVPKIIPEKQLGTAYAVIFFIQNIGLMLIPLLLGVVLNSTNPNVAPNKTIIRKAVEMSYTQALKKENITLDAKALNIAIEKTTSGVVDSIVESASYVPTPQSEINPEKVENSIVSSNLNMLGSPEMGVTQEKVLDKMGSTFKKATFEVVTKEKLNIRYDYQYDILMFTLLGILALLFAFLLKREDFKKGYGLEKPNIES